MNIQQTSKKTQVAIMNAVHDLPVLVARDRGFFKDEGLDIEFVTTPGMAQVTTSHLVKFDSVFDRPLDSVYNDGGIDQYRMCEWGIMKRAVEANAGGLRGRKIVALGASMSKFAIVVAGDSDVYEPEMLKNKPIAVTPNNGSHFTTLKMMEGFLALEHIKTTACGLDAETHRGVAPGQSRGGEPDGALDQRGAEDGPAHSHRVALDPQRGGRRRPRRQDASGDVSRPGAGGQGAREGPHALHPLLHSRRPAGSWSRTSSRPGASCTPRRSPTRASASTTPTTGRSSGT